MIHRQDITILRPLRSASTLLLLLALGGCGSQIDSIDTPDTRPTSPAPAGIYEGEVISTTSGATLDVVAFVDGNRRMLMFTEDGVFIASGVYTANLTNMALSARVFRLVSVTDEEGETAVETEISEMQAPGGFVPEDSIDLSYSESSGGTVRDIGSVALDYLKLQYEQRSDLPLLEGTWGQEDQFGTPVSSYSISQDGRVFGSDNAGCTYEGEFRLIDLHYNLYRLTMTQNCGATRVTGTGMATLEQTLGAKPRIIGAVATDQAATSFSLDLIN